MYRHYEGNSGRSRVVPEPEKSRGKYMGKSLAPVPAKPDGGEKSGGKRPSYNSPPSRPVGLSGELGRLFGKAGPLKLETEDLLLIAVLYLMYRESGDKELLIMMGALLFL